MNINPNEALARTRKAQRLAFLLYSYDISVEDTWKMTGEQWNQLAEAARVRHPSETTIKEVRDHLGQMEMTREALKLRTIPGLQQAMREEADREVSRFTTDRFLATALKRLAQDPAFNEVFKSKLQELLQPGKKSGDIDD